MVNQLPPGTNKNGTLGSVGTSFNNNKSLIPLSSLQRKMGELNGINQMKTNNSSELQNHDLNFGSTKPGEMPPQLVLNEILKNGLTFDYKVDHIQHTPGAKFFSVLFANGMKALKIMIGTDPVTVKDSKVEKIEARQQAKLPSIQKRMQEIEKELNSFPNGPEVVLTSAQKKKFWALRSELKRLKAMQSVLIMKPLKNNPLFNSTYWNPRNNLDTFEYPKKQDGTIEPNSSVDIQKNFNPILVNNTAINNITGESEMVVSKQSTSSAAEISPASKYASAETNPYGDEIEDEPQNYLTFANGFSSDNLKKIYEKDTPVSEPLKVADSEEDNPWNSMQKYVQGKEGQVVSSDDAIRQEYQELSNKVNAEGYTEQEREAFLEKEIALEKILTQQKTPEQNIDPNTELQNTVNNLTSTVAELQKEIAELKSGKISPPIQSEPELDESSAIAQEQYRKLQEQEQLRAQKVEQMSNDLESARNNYAQQQGEYNKRSYIDRFKAKVSNLFGNNSEVTREKFNAQHEYESKKTAYLQELAKNGTKVDGIIDFLQKENSAIQEVMPLKRRQQLARFAGKIGMGALSTVATGVGTVANSYTQATESVLKKIGFSEEAAKNTSKWIGRGLLATTFGLMSGGGGIVATVGNVAVRMGGAELVDWAVLKRVFGNDTQEKVLAKTVEKFTDKDLTNVQTLSALERKVKNAKKVSTMNRFMRGALKIGAGIGAGAAVNAIDAAYFTPPVEIPQTPSDMQIGTIEEDIGIRPQGAPTAPTEAVTPPVVVPNLDEYGELGVEQYDPSADTKSVVDPYYMDNTNLAGQSASTESLNPVTDQFSVKPEIPNAPVSPAFQNEVNLSSIDFDKKLQAIRDVRESFNNAGQEISRGAAKEFVTNPFINPEIADQFNPDSIARNARNIQDAFGYDMESATKVAEGIKNAADQGGKIDPSTLFRA